MQNIMFSAKSGISSLYFLFPIKQINVKDKFCIDTLSHSAFDVRIHRFLSFQFILLLPSSCTFISREMQCSIVYIRSTFSLCKIKLILLYKTTTNRFPELTHMTQSYYLHVHSLFGSRHLVLLVKSCFLGIMLILKNKNPHYIMLSIFNFNFLKIKIMFLTLMCSNVTGCALSS